MRARRLLGAGLFIVLVVSVAAAEKIRVLDNCDATDPTWNSVGGCTLEEGNVTLAEFNLLLNSPLSAATVGHPAWRNEPSYLTIEVGDTVRARNDGGRGHTFTEVTNFGGGRVPPLNHGLTPAPECALVPGAVDPNALAPGVTLKITGLGIGLHRFQCCIHPWMRAAIRVTAAE
jgi:plastocyanin